MKSPFRIVVFLLLGFSMVGCVPKANIHQITSGDYLIIGHPGGFVNTPLITYYYLNSTQLTKDTTVPYAAVPVDNSKFNFSATGTSLQHTVVATMLTGIPAELLGKNNQDIGNLVPDVGYIDMRASIKDVTYKWSFESDQTSSSQAVKDFVTQARTLFN